MRPSACSAIRRRADPVVVRPAAWPPCQVRRVLITMQFSQPPIMSSDPRRSSVSRPPAKWRSGPQSRNEKHIPPCRRAKRPLIRASRPTSAPTVFARRPVGGFAAFGPPTATTCPLDGIKGARVVLDQMECRTCSVAGAGPDSRIGFSQDVAPLPLGKLCRPWLAGKVGPSGDACRL